MKFIDLQTPYELAKAEFQSAIHRVLEHGQYINGPEITELEPVLAQYVGAKHCITMSSGTTALKIPMMALDIGPGDEVITTTFSFFATAETIIMQGAKPVFVDVDPKTFNLDPALLEAAITPRTKLILPVSLYGQCAEMDAINAIAAKYQLPVLEDAAQSFGATYRGRRSGALTTMAATSFFPSKPLGCYGDGGAAFTNDDALAEKMRMILNHGQKTRYVHECIGMNGRFDTIQAAILLIKMPFFEEELEKRQQVAKAYTERFQAYGIAPYIEPHNKSAFAQYTLQVNHRDQFQQCLQAEGIPTAIHYPMPLHWQPIFRSMHLDTVSYPVAENVANRVISLPFHPYLTEETIDRIAKTVIETIKQLDVAAV